MRVTSLVYILFFAGLLAFPEAMFAQQARGLFFSVFGPDAEPSYGDFNHIQAIYFDIPENETLPIYLRVFNANIGGYLDQRVGSSFNTRMRYLILGGESARKVYGADHNSRLKGVQAVSFSNADVVSSRIFSNDAAANGRYVNIGELDKSKGLKTGDGYLRFVLLVIGLEGNDGNFYDLGLSYNPNDKDEPEDYRSFTYALNIRTPAWESHRYQISIPVNNGKRFSIGTFGLNGNPITLSMPFRSDIPLKPSDAGNWVFNPVEIYDPEHTAYFGINVFAGERVNSFAVTVLDENNKPVKIPLPIPDYREILEPEVSYRAIYNPNDKYEITLEKTLKNGRDFRDLHTNWVVDGDTLRGDRIAVRFDTLGFKPYELMVSGSLGGERRFITIRDSVLISDFPTAWAGADRIFVASEPMAFDGTVSEPVTGRIARYEWNFGDGNRATGARIDHTYRSPGLYWVTLVVTDDSNTPFNSAADSILVRINEPPIPFIDAPIAAQFGETITISGNKSRSRVGLIDQYIWQIGNQAYFGETISHTISKQAPLDITLTVIDNSGMPNDRASASHTVRINRAPIADAGTDKLISPSNPVTFDGRQSRDTDGRIVKHEWIFPGDIIVEGPVVRQGIEEPGMHLVVLRVTDNEGAQGTDTMNVQVNFPPVPVIAGSDVHNAGRVTLSAADSYDQDGEIIRYLWDLGDGTVSDVVEVSHIYRRPGTYTVTLTVVDDSRTLSSVQKTTKNIFINQPPIARLTGPGRVGKNNDARFSAAGSTDPDGEITEYRWDFGDGTIKTGKEVNHIFERAGTYQVQLLVRDNSGLEDAVAYAYKDVVVNAPPVLVARHPRRAVPGEPVRIDLSESYDPNGGKLSYYWKIDGEWRNGTPYREFVFRPGNHSQVQFAVADDSGLEGSRTYGQANFFFNQSPVAVAGNDIRTDRNMIVLDGSKSFDPDGDELRFYWDLGDGNTKEGPIVVHNYREGGTYQAILTVDDQQGLDNSFAYDTVKVFINRPPQVAFQTPGTVCAMESVEFDGSLTYDPDGNETLTYYWEFGDGKVGQGMRIPHIFDREGTYLVTLTADDNERLANSRASFTDQVNVVGAPVAHAGSNLMACAREMVQFDGSNSRAADNVLSEYRWDFGDGNTGNGMQPFHSYQKPGFYTVTLTVVGNQIGSCSNTSTDQITVVVEPIPVADFHIPGEISTHQELALDASASLVDDVTIQRFTWRIDTLETITWRRQTRFDADTRDFQQYWVMNSNLKEGNNQEADRSMYGELPVIYKELKPGTYNITLEVEISSTADCKVATSTQTVRVVDAPEFVVEEFPLLIPGEQFVFRPRPNGGRLRDVAQAKWVFGDGTERDGLEAVHAFDKPGVFDVIFRTDDGRGTRNSIQEIVRKIRVNAAPVPIIQGPIRAEPGTILRYSAEDSYVEDGEIIEYRWFFSDGHRAEGKTVEHTFDRHGNYSVTLTVVDNAGVVNSTQSSTRRIQISDRPELTMKLPTVICPGVQLNLAEAFSLTPEDSSMVDLYIGNRQISFRQARNMQFNFPGQYNIRLVMHDGSGEAGSSRVFMQSLRVNGTPEIYAAVPQQIRIGAASDRVTFDAGRSFDPDGDILSFYWDLGDGNRKAGRTITHTYANPGRYTVRLTVVDDKGLSCSFATKEYQVTVVKD